VLGSRWRAEAGALDGQKDVDVGERRAPVVVGVPALTQQVGQLARTLAAGGPGRWVGEGQVPAAPASQRVHQLVVAEPVVRTARRRG